MTSEGTHFYKYLVLGHDSILQELKTLPLQALNWPLEIPETNTMYASAYHAAGAMQHWIVVTVGRGTMERERDAEFRARGDLASLELHWEQSLKNCREVLQHLSSPEYDTIREVRRLDGSLQQWSVRECLLHVVEHTNIHVGHIQLSRQLWERVSKE